jgi:hypothetical protein
MKQVQSSETTTTTTTSRNKMKRGYDKPVIARRPHNHSFLECWSGIRYYYSAFTRVETHGCM